MTPARAYAALWATLGLTLVGCSSELSFGRLFDAGGASPDDAGQAVVPDASAAFSCSQRGPLFDLSDGAPGACGAGSRGFHYAACACEELVSMSTTFVDGFDSQVGAYAAGQHSGALATNRGLYLERAEIGGSVLIAGELGTPLTGDLSIGGNLHDQGPLQGPYAVRVEGNAEVGGDVRVAALRVAGSFALADDAALEVTAGAPAVVRTTVDIPPACSCSPLLDLATLIDAASRDNDNAAIGLDPENGLKVFDAEREVELPCGRYYVGDIYAARALTVRVTGRVALYVQHGIVVENTAAFTVVLENAAELDLFVAQGIAASGPVSIGSPGTPTRARLHFGATDSLNFRAPTLLATSLYAPRSELVAQGGFELFGAALLRRIASGALTLHYDRALARDPCSAARCTTSKDCADGLRCDGARCLP